jgi:hypothetical protein
MRRRRFWPATSVVCACVRVCACARVRASVGGGGRRGQERRGRDLIFTTGRSFNHSGSRPSSSDLAAKASRR